MVPPDPPEAVIVVEPVQNVPPPLTVTVPGIASSDRLHILVPVDNPVHVPTCAELVILPAAAAILVA